VRLVTLLTKADKLNRREAQQALAAAQEVLGPHAAEPADVSVTLFSALSRQGVGDVAQTLHAWAEDHRAAKARSTDPAAPPEEAA
jgi:GTP-binding protein